MVSGQTASTASSSSLVDPYTVRGKVLNGLDGSGVPRALVTLASRKVLTDPQGNFQFQGFTLAKATMTATKPGFSQTADGAPLWRGFNSPDLTAPVVLTLYPNAVITGIVTGRDALPVVGAQVRLMTANLAATGLRWAPVGDSVTDSRGEYRFNQAPGRYRVELEFRATERETGDVILPISFPELSSSDKSNYFVVGSGQERRIDLQARTGPGYPVLVKTSITSARGFRFSVTTARGDSFNLAAEPLEDGVYRLTLPTGTYTVRGHMDRQDLSEEGSARVTVTSRPGPAVPLQLAPLTSLPLEVSVDPASVSTTTSATGNSYSLQQPNPGQFGLRLHNERNVGDGVDGDINLTFARVQPGAAQQAEFRVPPGRYRLEGSGGGSWHVESANLGPTNLLESELVIGPGAAGMPIRLVVDNRTGSLTGTVRMPDTVATAWVYLISQSVSLGAPNPLSVTAGSTFSTKLPIGRYHVLAIDHPLQMDQRDPAVVKEFSTAVQDVEVTLNSTATVQLDLARQKGATQ